MRRCQHLAQRAGRPSCLQEKDRWTPTQHNRNHDGNHRLPHPQTSLCGILLETMKTTQMKATRGQIDVDRAPQRQARLPDQTHKAVMEGLAAEVTRAAAVRK